MSRGQPPAKPRRDPVVTSKVMAAVKSKNTRPELALRRYLFARGLRYRIHPRDIMGRPDIVFRRQRIAVFVDGDFWHGHGSDLRLHERREFWEQKIAGNVARDVRVNSELVTAGWRVIRIFTSELEIDLAAAADRVVQAVQLDPGGRGIY